MQIVSLCPDSCEEGKPVQCVMLGTAVAVCRGLPPASLGQTPV